MKNDNVGAGVVEAWGANAVVAVIVGVLVFGAGLASLLCFVAGMEGAGDTLGELTVDRRMPSGGDSKDMIETPRDDGVVPDDEVPLDDGDDAVYGGGEFKVLTRYDFELAAEFGAQDLAVRNVIGSIEAKIRGQVRPHGYFIKTTNERPIDYRPEGFNSDVSLDKVYGLRGVIQDSHVDFGMFKKILADEKLNDAIISALSELGFVGYDYDASGDEQSDVEHYINEGTGVICDVDASYHGDVVSCGNIAWIDGGKAELSNELVDAYKVATGVYPTSLSVSIGDIVDSSYAPYQRIVIGVQEGMSGAVGLFYRVSVDAEWVYFTSTQDLMSCAEFNTEDLRRAFAGEECWNGSDNKVTP